MTRLGLPETVHFNRGSPVVSTGQLVSPIKFTISEREIKREET